MKKYPSNRYWINIVELRVCWSQLRRVLRVTMLPRCRVGVVAVFDAPLMISC